MISFRNKIDEKNRLENLKKNIQKYHEDIQSIKKYKYEQYKIYQKYNKEFQLKPQYDSKIPLNLYTCWHTKELPPLMKQNYEQLKIDNPEFNHFLYDENECRDFIKNNFDNRVLNAYNLLIPCSYKSDLWRFCILYVNGGIYLDIKYKCVNGFKFISLTENEYFTRDIGEKCVYTALIVTMPKNEILLKCINQIVINVQNKYYGPDALYPTGPGLLGSFFTDNEKKQLELFHDLISDNISSKFFIVYKDTLILHFYSGYREEQAKYQKNKHYLTLWKEKKIYYKYFTPLKI